MAGLAGAVSGAASGAKMGGIPGAIIGGLLGASKGAGAQLGTSLLNQVGKGKLSTPTEQMKSPSDSIWDDNDSPLTMDASDAGFASNFATTSDDIWR